MKKKYFLALCLLIFSYFVNAADFITRWDLSQTGSGSNQINFTTATAGIVNYTWETIPAGTTVSGTFIGTSATITGLPSGAMIRLKIQPSNFERFIMNPSADKDRLMDVEQWGSVAWTSMGNAFCGCSNLNITATDVPNLVLVSDMSVMFGECNSLNNPANINTWNTANVINMDHMFYGTTSFNQPLNNWNTSNVTNMSGMFAGATSFNQPLGNWSVGNVLNMGQMFEGAASFNQPIGNWNTGSVTSMMSMFWGASSFNQLIGN